VTIRRLRGNAYKLATIVYERALLRASAALALGVFVVCGLWAGVAAAGSGVAPVSVAVSAGGVRVSTVPGRGTTLRSIACVSRTRCYAAGLLPSGAGAIVPVVAGRPERTVKVDGAGLEGISCAGPGTCEAVGETGRSQLAAVVPVMDGHPGPVTKVGKGVYVLQDVSCVSAGVCEAVGGDQGVLVQTVDGTPSESQGVPGIGDFASISCASAADCEAVGNGIDTLDGSYASVSDGTPTVTRREPDQIALQAISCPTADTCEAAGGFAYPHRHEAVIATVNDGTLGTPHVLANLGISSAIACPTATTCYALVVPRGRSEDARTVLVSIVNGRAGAERSLPDVLDSIACPSTNLCYASGNEPTRPSDGVVVTVPVTS